MKKPKKTEDPSPVLFGSAAPAAAPQPKRAKSALAFSYSKLSLYEECPLKYKFKYIDKIKEEPKTFFAFGTRDSDFLAIFEFLSTIASTHYTRNT